jgi:hypothetical protein
MANTRASRFPSVERCSKVLPATEAKAPPSPQMASTATAVGNPLTAAIANSGTPEAKSPRTTDIPSRWRNASPAAAAEPSKAPMPVAPTSKPAAESPPASTAWEKETLSTSSEPATRKETPTTQSKARTGRSPDTLRRPATASRKTPASSSPTFDTGSRRRTVSIAAASMAALQRTATSHGPTPWVMIPAITGPAKPPTPSETPAAALADTRTRGVVASCGTAA